MNDQDLSLQLLALDDAQAQQQLLGQQVDQLDDDAAQGMKDLADKFLRSDVQRSLQIADLLLLVSEQTGDPRHRALGLLARANAQAIGLGQYETALISYEAAVAIYKDLQSDTDQAKAQVGKVWALACLGLYGEALSTADQATSVLRQAEDWQALATLTMNLAIVHGRRGDDAAALAAFDQAYAYYERLGPDGVGYLSWIEQNRSIVLRNLGRFKDSIQASQRAWEGMRAAGQAIEAARARQSLAITYLTLGRYNEALVLFEEARTVFEEDGRQRDAILLDLFLSDCLLQMRRFRQVLDICRHARQLFQSRGAQLEIGQTLLNEAVAYTGLGQYEDARQSLSEARGHFSEEGNPAWQAVADLEEAALLSCLGQTEESKFLLQGAASQFRELGLVLREAQAQLIAARIAVDMGSWDKAEAQALQVLDIARNKGLPSLRFQAHHLLGQIVQQQGDPHQALAEYEQAIYSLERLHGRLMIEFRSDFLQDKASVYEDAVISALAIDDPSRALELAERAKSRALLTMVTHRLDMRLQARQAGDQPLVEELMQLRGERDRLLLRWETREDLLASGEQHLSQQKVLELEQQITERWHRLLVHNADYARDALLWQVRTESAQPYLDDDTVILEYFFAHDRWYVFSIDRNNVAVQELDIPQSQIQRLLQMWTLNARSAMRAGANQIGPLIGNAQGVLKKLYDHLLGPLADNLAAYKRIIIVPHGALHYLPFHALYDGSGYLIEKWEVTYLPGSSLLRYCNELRPQAEGLFACGYSRQGALPYAVQEAQTIADIMAGEVLVEEGFTGEALARVAAKASILHLATHGEFRNDNPLFSGLILADGWLTTLDVFNMRLQASLVTLSACQTGRHVVGGGDELLGLTRGFLYAGAASLVLSYWQVEDRATTDMMAIFYQQLAGGERKGEALRTAQLALLQRSRTSTADRKYTHPLYWAPFFLVGDPGHLEGDNRLQIAD